MTTDVRPVTILDFDAWKKSGRKISTLTAYDYPTARWLDQAGVDCLLVGDSLGTAVQGHKTTLGVTLDQMVYHTEMVARAAERAFVVADLPFLSYQASRPQAIRSAGRMLKETRCHAVKVEGGRRSSSVIRAIVDAEIPVMAHIGLTPQSVRKFGGFKVQRQADAIREDAQAVVDAGAFAVVLECVPAAIAAAVTSEIPIPTIGIGAGPACDGQVLVIHDMIGFIEGFRPRFARRYREVGEMLKQAGEAFVADVQSGEFPNDAESFH